MGAYFTNKISKKVIMESHKSPKNTQNNENMLIMGPINAKKYKEITKNIQGAGLGALAHDPYYWALIGAYFPTKKS